MRSLDLTMYENQIFCLLGHNGAGKTTTLHMLTGLYAPTSGGGHVYGKDINTQMKEIRRVIGVCPQHNVLWDDLTVTEHLRIFARLYGVAPATVERAVAQGIAAVGLTEKVNVRSKNLSGGMKRKLSLAMSLIGDCKTVFLDEPTSGMDPFSRRATWNTLKDSRKGRVMVLTTHFMDEARPPRPRHHRVLALASFRS